MFTVDGTIATAYYLLFEKVHHQLELELEVVISLIGTAFIAHILLISVEPSLETVGFNRCASLTHLS